MRDIDQEEMNKLENTCRDIGHAIGDVLGDLSKPKERVYGFCLMLFSFEGPEFTYISNAKRSDMIKALDEFKERLKEQGQ